VAMNAAPELSVPARAGAEVVWHDLECGSYTADLPLWSDLAARHPGPVLELGAGSGRVALALAREGHAVTALEREPALLEALRSRADASLACVLADARSFVCGVRRFGLCLVPMQAVQLFGGPSGRAEFLRRAHAALRPGGLLACALLADVEQFDCAGGEPGPEPESALIDGLLFISVPTRVAANRRSVVIERERSIHAVPSRAPSARGRARQPPIHRETNVIRLDRLSPSKLRREALAAGFRNAGEREVPPTADHAGSVVVMLRA
jgi:SAM-dependent methyltransferase